MFVTKSDLKTLDLLKREKSFPPRMTENQGIMDFLSDLINHRFVHKENKPRGAFMKIFFENKGIEKVNIGSLLHKVNDAIPKNFKLNSVPTVIFTRSSTIGSKKFNYKKTIEDLDTKT